MQIDLETNTPRTYAVHGTPEEFKRWLETYDNNEPFFVRYRQQLLSFANQHERLVFLSGMIAVLDYYNEQDYV